MALYSTQLDLLMALNRQFYEVLYSDPPPQLLKKQALRDQCWDLERDIDRMQQFVESMKKMMSDQAQMNMMVVHNM